MLELSNTFVLCPFCMKGVDEGWEREVVEEGKILI